MNPSHFRSPGYEVVRRLTAVAVALAAILAPSPSRAAELDWEPENTWVFAIGILEWQHPDVWASFPDAKPNRSDAQLVKHFRDAGVPDEQIVYLQDAKATKAHIIKSLTRFLEQTDEGATLIFYFAGHGYRDQKSRQTWLAQYDAGDKNGSGWNVRHVFELIENHFYGDRVLLIADCCHSGALCEEMSRRSDSELSYAALTSVYSHNTSTGNWTFTDAVLAALRGDPRVDGDGDQFVELNELADYAEREMAFVEGQKAMFTAAASFPRQAKLAPVADAIKKRVGERAEALAEGKWYKVKILDVDGPKVKVHFIGYGENEDTWTSAKFIRPYAPKSFAVGAEVSVRSEDGNWYPATVRKSLHGLHWIHYDDYDSTWDEWVGPAAIRTR